MIGVFDAIEPKALEPVDFLWGALSLLLALAIAGVSLFGGRLEGTWTAPLRQLADELQSGLGAIHSGHVGDYVAWLTAAAGGLAVLVALAIRRARSVSAEKSSAPRLDNECTL